MEQEPRFASGKSTLQFGADKTHLNLKAFERGSFVIPIGMTGVMERSQVGLIQQLRTRAVGGLASLYSFDAALNP